MIATNTAAVRSVQLATTTEARSALDHAAHCSVFL